MGTFENLKNYIVELYEYRNVLRSLVSKNLFGKYRNSLLGFSWNFITPIILMIMYYVVFTEIRGDTGIENRWVFISTAIFLFHFLTRCIVGGTAAFTGNAGIIKKMYFPKEILVFSTAISNMIVCIIGYSVVLLMMLLTSYTIEWKCILVMLLLLLLSFMFGIGCIFILSSIAVYVRDIQYALGSIGIALFIMTPMRYMASDASGMLSVIIWYNPLTYYIEVAHDLLYWSVLPNDTMMITCCCLSFVSLILGYAVFHKLKRGMVKRI